ncbi:MAG: metallophosphoesterase, partial [Saccharofermentanales bacterium]
MTGKIILYVFLAVSVLLIARGIYETHVLDITRTMIGTGNKRIKVLLLSDIHAQYYFIHENRLLKALRTEDLSAVLFAGDLVNGNRDMDKGLRILSKVVQEASVLRIPVYAVSGNHDPEDIGTRLEGIGIRYLSNRSDYLTAADGSVWRIIGLEDFRTGRPSYTEATSQDCRAPLEPDSSSSPALPSVPAAGSGQAIPEIVLAHNPETLFRIIEDRKQSDVPGNGSQVDGSAADSPTPGSSAGIPSPAVFLLSGHFHGGQIWMPFNVE